MGKLTAGPEGPIIGRLGHLIYYVSNGKYLVRTAPGKSSKMPTLLQMESRLKMKVTTAFIKSINEVTNIGFMELGRSAAKSAYSQAISYQRMHALSGSYPEVTIDYAKVMISTGSLEGATDPSFELLAAGLRFSWLSSSPAYYPRGDDQTILLAYFPALGKAAYSLYGAKRTSGTALLAIPENLLAEQMEVYMCFVSADRKQVSNSSYLGSLRY